MSNSVNKLNLADFVFRYLVSILKEQLPHNITVFLVGGFKDSKKAVKVEKNVCTREKALESDNEEVNSKMSEPLIMV